VYQVGFHYTDVVCI